MSACLEVSALDAGYGARAVLSGLRLGPVAPGSLVAVVGPNAVGKSTLLRAIAGLRPSRGRIALDGVDLATLDARARRRRVGYLPQALPQGSSLLAYEAVLSAARVGLPERSRGEIEAAVERVFDRLGLRAIALRRLDELSGGQRQMVGLAQVVLREPRLLLLDEPTSALDLRWQLEVLQNVRALVARGGGVCLMAVHDLNLALRFCDRIAVLGEGRVLAEGAPGEVFTPALLRRAYGVDGRVERCSQGHRVVVVDRVSPP